MVCLVAALAWFGTTSAQALVQSHNVTSTCIAGNVTERALLAQAYAAPVDYYWVTNRVEPHAARVIAALARADAFGLRVDDYCVAQLTRSIEILKRNPTLDELARFEVDLSVAALRLIVHLQRGRVTPQQAGVELPPVRHELDAREALRTLAASTDPLAVFASFEKPGQFAKALRAALARYRALATRTDLPQLVPQNHTLVHMGDSYADAPRLRRLLAAFGDLPEAAASDASDVMDESLTTALRRFQARHGLTVDGVLGPRTQAALAVPLAQRVRQIELALERWRWLPALQPPVIVINVPQFMLFALPRTPAEQALEIPVIVGGSDRLRRTPLFASAIEQVVFRPYWDVPRSILVRELLPQIRRDPQYLARHNMEIVAGQADRSPVLPPTRENIEALAAGSARLRQRPGPDNALGPVKFVLPNRHQVFLHGTPNTELFAQPRRDFSHGCIRVENPVALAAYVLKNAAGDWSEARIEAALCGAPNQRVRLHTPIPVYIVYGTALATRDTVLFFDDIYGYDRQLEALLGLAPVSSR